LLGQSDYDCITLDISLGRRSGIEILRLFKEVRCKTPIIVISGTHESIAKMAIGVGTLAKLNMCKPIPKPVNLKFLGDTLARIKQQAGKSASMMTLAGWTSETPQESPAG
jgi:DNA-binding response OmpR family regulator